MLELFPAELKERDQWVAWRYVERDGKRTKPPVNVHNPARLASSTDPSTWASFADAVAVLNSGRVEGIGYVLQPGEGLVGFDLDNCRDPQTAALAPWAQAIVDRLSSYAEVTPSRRGVRVWVRAEIPQHITRRRRGDIEVYTKDRYFTVTGGPIQGAPLTIEQRQHEVEELLAELGFAPSSANGTHPNGNEAHPASTVDEDEALLERACGARNGASFQRLWEGDTTGHGGDDSAADIDLCGRLAFWAGPDQARIDRLFRQSGLMREKWDSARGDTTYGAKTIALALDDKKDFYKPPCRDSLPVVTAPKEESPETADTGAEHSWKTINLNDVGDGPTERPSILDLLYAARRHSGQGDSETCKSLFGQICCLEVARQGRTSMFIETDGAGRYETRNRFIALGATPEELARILYIEPDEPFGSPTIQTYLAGLVDEHDPGLVVVDAMDSFLTLHGLDPNSNKDVDRAWRALDPLRKNTAPIFAVDHVVKDPDRRGSYAAGAGRKRYGVDVALGFEIITPFGRGRTGRIKITTAKDRPGWLPRPKAAELELHSNPDTGAITWTLHHTQPGETHNFRPTGLMEKASRIAELETLALTKTEIAERTGGRRGYALQAVGILLAEHHLEADNNGRIRSLKPYRETEE